MNWLQKTAQNYFEQGKDWGYGPQMELKDKLFELFKVEYVIGELKRRSHMNQRLRYRKRQTHWVQKLEEHAWELASEDVGPGVLEGLTRWMASHHSDKFAEDLMGLEDPGTSGISDDGTIDMRNGFVYQLQDEVAIYFLKQNPSFVQEFIDGEIESRTQDQEYDPEAFAHGGGPEEMATWNFDQQVAYIIEWIESVGYTFQQLREWLSEWGDFDGAVLEVLRQKVYPAWRTFWGDQLEVAEENISDASERLQNSLQGQNLGDLLASINIALNAQHVHGAMGMHMDVSDDVLEELSNLNTDELDQFVNKITGEQWTTASWLTRVAFGWSDVGHAALDVGGLVPGVGEALDLTNAIWYAQQGQHLNAAFSLISMIPAVGDIVGKGGKFTAWLGKAGPQIMAVKQKLQASRPLINQVMQQARQNPKLAHFVDQMEGALNAFLNDPGETPPPAV